MMIRMHVNMHDLMVINHALGHYMDRTSATKKELRSESNLLDRINDNIKILRRLQDGEETQK